MPVIDPPGGTPALPPVQAESADGRVRVISHPEGGGVFVLADFSDLSPAPKMVRFVRGADRVPVRSGNDAWAPGGQAVAFDREAPSGQSSAWYAIPIMRIGGQLVEGQMSQGAQVVAPAPDKVHDLWIKSVNTPVDLRLEMWGPDPVFSLEGRNTAQPRIGSGYVSGSYDTPIVQPMSYTTTTYSHAEFDHLLAVMKNGGPLLVQTAASYGIADEFALFGSMQWEYRAGAFNPQEREVTIKLQPINRPPTAESPLLIPGRTFDLVASNYLSFDHITASLDEFYDLLITAPPVLDSLIPETGGAGDEGLI